MNPSALISSWAASLWTASWQGLVFVALVWGICSVFRPLPASIKAWLWWLASLKLLLGLLWSGFALPFLPAAETSPLAKLNHRLDLLAPKASVTSRVVTQAPKSPHSIAHRSQEADIDWIATGLLTFWAGGVLIVGASVASQGVKIRRLIKSATPAGPTRSGEIARELGAKTGLSKRPSLLFTQEITAPMVAGIVRPILLLPANIETSLSEDELKLCLAHELAHIKRRDLPLALIPTVAQALYFFFPPAWLIRREWEIEREAACDADAIAITNGSPAAYGRLLVKVVTMDHRGGLAPALGATANYHTLKKRIDNMKHFTPTPRRMKVAATILASLAMLLAIPWQMTARATSSPPPPVDDKNVVVNGGMEEVSGSNVAGWTMGSLPPDTDVPVTVSLNRIRDDDGAMVKATAHRGHGSISFSKTENRYFPVKLLSQQIPYHGEKQIKVSMWAKAQDAKKFTLAVIMQGGEGKIEWGAYIGDKNGGGQAITHDWKQYTSVINIPSGTTDIILALEMYGPGTVYVDDVAASYTSGAATTSGSTSEDEDALADIKNVTNEDRKVSGDPMMRYFLIGGGLGQDKTYKLLLVMPGGDGSADFNPFIRRIWKNALPPGYLIAELVAPKWSDDQFNAIVWPTHKQKWQGMKFSTEDFVEAVIKNVRQTYKLDPNAIYTLSWSSGGPAAYATALSSSAIKGSFVAMSVFKPDLLPPLFNAKGQAFYIYHSPEDNMIPMAMPTLASKELAKAGARTQLDTYEGGHGWHGDIFGSIRKGVEWLERG